MASVRDCLQILYLTQHDPSEAAVSLYYCHGWPQLFFFLKKKTLIQIDVDTQLQEVFKSFLEYSPLPLIHDSSFANNRREKREERERTEITIFLIFGMGGSFYSPIFPYILEYI